MQYRCYILHIVLQFERHHVWELFDEIRANLSYNEILQYLEPPVFDQKETEGKLQIGMLE